MSKTAVRGLRGVMRMSDGCTTRQKFVRIYEFLESEGPCTSREISSGCGMSFEEVRSLVGRMRDRYVSSDHGRSPRYSPLRRPRP